MSLGQVRAWFVRLGGFLNSEKQDRDFEQEINSHLQMHIDDLVQSGMSPAEAKRQALIKLGGVEPIKEQHRDQRKIEVIETVVRDFRYALRRLSKSPTLTIIAILSLALGIGANTAIFSLVNTAALRPLPIKNPDKLISLTNSVENHMFPVFSYPNYKDFRDRNTVFEGLLAYRFAPLSMSRDGVNERLWGYLVSGNYFKLLGINAALGRVISQEDDRLAGAHPVVVLSYQSWRQRFVGDPAVIGKNLRVNGSTYTVIGVAQKGFNGTEIISAPELYFPIMMQGQIEAGNEWLDERSVQNIFVQGVLKPGISNDRAAAEIKSISVQLEKEHPNENEGKRVSLSTPGFMGGLMRGKVLGFTGILMAVVAFVLLLACTNLANLLLARATTRRTEIAVHLAMGASRLRLIWQLMTESMLLAIGSGLCGLLLAFWFVRAAAVFKPPMDVPLKIDLHLDYRVLIFTFLITVLTGIFIGLLPALQTTKIDLQDALKDKTSFATYKRSFMKNGLIVFQVMLSLILLIGAGLMSRALQRAYSVNLGFDPQNAIAVTFDLRLQGYNNARGREFQKQLLQRLRSIPGIQAAGIIDLAPVDLHFSRTPIFVEGQPAVRALQAPHAMTSRITPGYFDAMNTRIIRGRDFTDQDDVNSQPVAIINETFAKRFWPNQDPIGKRFIADGPDEPKLLVVGVVQDGKYGGLNEKQQLYFCRPQTQAYLNSSTVIVRTNSVPQRMIPVVRKEIEKLDPYMPLSSAKTMVEKMAAPLMPARIAAYVLGAFGILALLLAAIGIYGVMSYAVSTRTQEIGVRVALGAKAADVLKLTIFQGMTLVIVGAVLGIAIALALTKFTRSMLFGLSSADPLTYTTVAVILMFVALLACYIPARRASKIDPIAALRYE